MEYFCKVAMTPHTIAPEEIQSLILDHLQDIVLGLVEPRTFQAAVHRLVAHKLECGA